MQAQGVMTAVVATVPADAAAHEAAKAMLERHVSALPAMDDKDRVVGIVSRAGLVRRLATAPTTAGPRAATDRARRDEVSKGSPHPACALGAQ